VPPNASSIEASVSPNEVDTRRVATQVSGGKSSRTSHATCGASTRRKTPAVIHGAAERK
jgi:hypothetical protein